MTIEEAIKVKSFDNEYLKATINIIFTASHFSLQNTQRLKPYGLSAEQFNVLRILRGQYPATSNILLLSERMLDRSSNASRIVEKLRLKELLIRKSCPNDRRAVEILITDKGLELLKKLDAFEKEWFQKITHVPEEDLVELNRILDLLRNPKKK